MQAHASTCKHMSSLFHGACHCPCCDLQMLTVTYLSGFAHSNWPGCAKVKAMLFGSQTINDGVIGQITMDGITFQKDYQLAALWVQGGGGGHAVK